LDTEQAGDTTTQADQTNESVVVMPSEPRPEDATVEQESTVSKSQANTRTTSQRNSRFCRLGLIALLAASVVGGGLWLWTRILLALHTVSTDDAYVAGHVTYIAPRIPGTILKVHVDDNQFVNKDQLIIELDPELYLRNKGSSVGIGLSTAVLQRRLQLHSFRLTESLQPLSTATANALETTGRFFTQITGDPARGQLMGLRAIRLVRD